MRTLGAGVALVVVGAMSPAVAADQKWEVEVHGGGVFDVAPQTGESKLPDPNSLVTSPLPQSSRIVPSWFFGDGSAQFNQALASLMLSGSIIPLDDVLQSPMADRRAGGSFGVRVSRELTRRFSAEFTFDAANDRLVLTSHSLTGLAVTRVTFLNAWNTFFQRNFGQIPTVSSAAMIEESRGRQIATTGSLVINLVDRGPLVPYAAIGVGALTNSRGAPSAHFVGNYGFTFPPIPVPIPDLPTFVVNETDTVAVRTVVDDHQLAVVIGGGFKYPIGSRFGVRLDIRDHVYANSQRVELDASPSSRSGSGSFIFFSGSIPRLVFGSLAGARATLSAPPISDFVTFRGTGTEHQINLTAGVFWKF